MLILEYSRLNMTLIWCCWRFRSPAFDTFYCLLLFRQPWWPIQPIHAVCWYVSKSTSSQENATVIHHWYVFFWHHRRFLFGQTSWFQVSKNLAVEWNSIFWLTVSGSIHNFCHAETTQLIYTEKTWSKQEWVNENEFSGMLGQPHEVLSLWDEFVQAVLSSSGLCCL